MGYNRLKNCQAGQLIRLQSGTMVLLTEYHTFNGGSGKSLDGYIVGSGEAFHPQDTDEWVMIIDLGLIEAETDNGDYPNASA